MTKTITCTRCGVERIVASGAQAHTITEKQIEEIANQIGWCIDGDIVNCDRCNIELCQDDEEE